MKRRRALDTVEANRERREMHSPFMQTETRMRSDEITIRLSSPGDCAAIRRLAELDGRQPPSGESILAIVGGELRAALPLGGGDAIADPFWPTTGLVELLRVRDHALHATGTRGRRAFPARIAVARLVIRDSWRGLVSVR
jgi:hypothetical protein